MTDPCRIVLVDDHPLFREGVAATLDADPNFEVVGQGASADDALRLATSLLPALLLLDLNLPGGGLNAARAVAEACPVTRIVMLTVSEDEADVLAALKAGARGRAAEQVQLTLEFWPEYWTFAHFGDDRLPPTAERGGSTKRSRATGPTAVIRRDTPPRSGSLDGTSSREVSDSAGYAVRA